MKRTKTRRGKGKAVPVVRGRDRRKGDRRCLRKEKRNLFGDRRKGQRRAGR